MANLYYVQPILFKIAQTFDVTFEEASQVATLLQAGYAAGLLLLCPLGDIFRRRPYILLLVFFTATLVSARSCPYETVYCPVYQLTKYLYCAVACIMSYTRLSVFCRHILHMRDDDSDTTAHVTPGGGSCPREQEGDMYLSRRFRSVPWDAPCPTAFRCDSQLHALAQHLLVRLWSPVLHIHIALPVLAGLPV